MADYSVTGNPISLSRGASSLIRVEFGLIQTAIATKVDNTGDTYTGTHDMTGATVNVAAPSTGSNAVTKTYADALAFSTALPAQALGLLVSDGANASFSTTFTGFAVNEVKGADIASAGTINLTTATGNLVHVTGTTTITAITIPSGAERTVVFDGALTLTHHATTLILPGAVNITTAAGDSMRVRGDGSGNARVVGYTRASGVAVSAGLVLLATLTPTAAANLDFLTTFTSGYDNYLIIGDGITPSADNNLAIRLAVAGASDTGSNYSAPLHVSSTTAAAAYVDVINTVESTGLGANFRIDILNANATSGLKSISVEAVCQNAATPGWSSNSASYAYFAANAVSGFRLYWTAAANFAAVGKVRVYGYSNT